MTAAPIRPFSLSDVDAAERFCAAARALDGAIESFSGRLRALAMGPRAVLDLWRVAVTPDGGVCGIALVARREASSPPVHDFYAAVHPGRRRQGIGRALSQPALRCGATLRARVREEAPPGIAFLRAAGFGAAGAQLMLHLQGSPPAAVRVVPGLRIRAAGAADLVALASLARCAWAGVPDAFASTPDEIAQLVAPGGATVLLAESGGAPIGYLVARELDGARVIEEVAVLPEFRRSGAGRALVGRALAGARGAVLSVSEANEAARELYRSVGFRQAARFVVMERKR